MLFSSFVIFRPNSVRTQSGDGNFIIVCVSGYWATNVYNSRETGFAVQLLDSGNLVVASTKSTIWTTKTANGLFSAFIVLLRYHCNFNICRVLHCISYSSCL